MDTSFTIMAIAIYIVAILIGMTVHEAMHAYAGYALGDTTAEEQGRLSLNPLRHIDPIYTVALPIITLLLFRAPLLAAKPVPFNPGRVRYGEFGAALIALAGPASNLVLACIAAVLWHMVGGHTFVGDALQLFVEVNVLLFTFNLIPIPPLDGSRILYAFAPEPIQGLMAAIEPYGIAIVFLVVLAGGLSGILSTLNASVLNFLL